MKLKYQVKENSFVSINQILRQEINISTRLLTKLINNQNVALNGNVCDTRIKPGIGDVIEVLLDYEENNTNIKPRKMDLNIIYEDEWMLAVDKPAGIVTHPSLRHFEDSLSNDIRYYFDTINLKKKIRPINRLDIDTSGIVIFAKNEYIQECLIRQMRDGAFQKEYICLVNGTLDKKNGTIDAPIARKEKSIIERCVSSEGKRAVTHYEVIKETENYSVVKCKLETGRTHQIRVHFAYIGHPLLGDTLYGQKSDLVSRQALHCYKLEFIHPVTKNLITLICKYY